MTPQDQPARSTTTTTELAYHDEDVSEPCKVLPLPARHQHRQDMIPDDQLAESATPTKDVPYTDEVVGLHKLKVGQPSNKKIAEGANFWIITFADEPFTENGHYSSGRGYTTQKEMVEWGFHEDRRWIAQGYDVNCFTKPSLVDLIMELNSHRERFGCFWPKTLGNTWAETGMSYNLRHEYCQWQWRRTPITAGDPKRRPRPNSA